MKEIIKITNSFYSNDLTYRIIKYLKNQKIIIMPSDTIYGFLCIREAEERLRIMKKRDDKPFLYLISDINDLEKLGINADKYMQLLEKNWPGPFTFIMKNNEGIKYGLRIPDNEYLRELVKNTGEPLLSTSVNYSGNPNMTDIEMIINEFGNKADLIIEDDDFMGIASSAIVDLTDDVIKIIRKGSRELIF